MTSVCFILAFFLPFICNAQDLQPFRQDALWGFKDKQGTIKIQPQFQYASKFFNGTAVVARFDSLGVIDVNNNVILPFKYQFLRHFNKSEFLFGYRAKYFGEYIVGIVTSKGHVKIPAQFNAITERYGHYTVLMQHDSVMRKGSVGDLRSVTNNYGVLDSDGLVIIPCKYDYINWLSDSLIVVTDQSCDGQALFSRAGVQITGFEYMVFGNLMDGMIKARVGNKYGFLNESGKNAIPVKFDYCEDFENGFALIQSKTQWGAINKKGTVVIKPNLAYDNAILAIKKLRESN